MLINKRLYALVYIFSSTAVLFGSPLDSLFMELQIMQESRLKNNYSDTRDSLSYLFDSTVQKLLISEEFCDLQLDSSILKNTIKVTYSDDQKLRIFSWDDLGGGNYHTFTNYIQYRNLIGKCIVEPFDTCQNNTEVAYYKIETVNVKNRMVYILLGYGTYGGGQHHRKIRFFQLLNDVPEECFEFYPNRKDLIITSNRTQDPDIKVETVKGTIIFKEFIFSEKTSFYEPEYKLRKVNLFKEKK